MELSLENYDPLPEDIKDGTNRKIYSNCLLDPEEEAAIQAFQEYTEKNQIEVPIWLYDDRRIALKLMNCVKKDLKKAVSAVQMYLEWASVPPELDDFVLQYLNQGLVYVCGRDRKFRPILVVNVRRVVDSKIDIDTLLRMDYLILNWITDVMLVPGKVETWNIIQDSNGVGVTEMPVHIIKAMASKLSIFYAHRIEKSFAINVPKMMNIIWKVVQVFIDSETKKKILIQRTGWEPVLAERISPENLEEKYGGILPDKISNFHPF